MRAAIAFILLAFWSAAPVVAEDLAARLQRLADTAVKEDDVIGIVIGAAPKGQGPVIVASGRARVNPNAPMTPGTEFEAASIAKTFIAALVLELVDERKLALDDKLSRYLPNVPNADRLSLRQLLNHTSGYDDYITDDFFDAAHAQRDKKWTLPELLAFAPTQLLEPPGTRYDYSNTNYLLLAMAIEAVTGNSTTTEIRRRFLKPLDLTHTWFLADGSVPAENLAHGYADLGDGGGKSDVTGEPWELSGADGGMVSNAGDLITWAQRIFGGRLLPERRLKEMLQFVEPSDEDAEPGSGYGLGVERIRVDGVVLYGHSGSAPGYNSMMLYEPATKTAIVVAINEDPDDEALLDIIAERIVRALEEPGTFDFPRAPDPDDAQSAPQTAPSSTPSSTPPTAPAKAPVPKG